MSSPGSKNFGNMMTDRSNLNEDFKEKKSSIGPSMYKQKFHNLNKQKSISPAVIKVAVIKKKKIR